jgi:diguanylate cyclase (GGDEF)-like protein
MSPDVPPVVDLHCPVEAPPPDDAHPLLETGRDRSRRSPRGRERRIDALATVAFLAAAAALVALFPPGGSFPLASGATLLAAYAALWRIEYRVGAGYTAPTELAFVPMLLLLPPSLVPLLAAAGYVLAKLPDCVRGSLPLDRMLLNVSGLWHTIGPALVLGLAGVDGPDWGDWPVYAFALVAQFTLDFASSGVRELAAGHGPLRRHLPGFGCVYAFDALLAPMGLLAAFASEEQPFAFVLVVPFALVFFLFAREREAHIDKAIELSRAYRGTARLLGDLLEDRDEDARAQNRDLVSLASAVGERMGLDDAWGLELTALLHDVGKMRIPNAILDKPAPLSDEEWAVMKTHVVEGQRMLEQVGGALASVGMLVRSSHERWDGRGYPDGLAAEQIPFASRIVSCCDAFHAMTSDRPYRPARTFGGAVAELRACAGSQFDPQVVEALMAVLGPPQPSSSPQPAGGDGGAETDGRARRSFRDATLSGDSEADAEQVAAVARATRRLAQVTEPAAARGVICEAALRVSTASAAALLEPVDDGYLCETGRAGAPSESLRGPRAVMAAPEPPERRFLPDAREHPGGPRKLLEAIGGVSLHLEPVVRGGQLVAVLALTWPERLERLPDPVATMMRLFATEVAMAIERTETLARLEAAARTDELTGVLARRAWEEELEREIARAAREGRPLCVAMLDIDYFKEFNDVRGHVAGDEVLRDSALAWRGELRLADQLGRYGGDEFIALMPGCTLVDAREVVQRLSAATPRGLTCSVGIAAWDGSETVDGLVARADAALLAAKQRGRDQVALAHDLLRHP